MRNRQATAIALALAAFGLGAACGSAATGISVAIEPDPVQATSLRDGSYVASWEAVVADLTGVGGTVQSVEAAVSGAASVTSVPSDPATFGQPSAAMAVAPFARRMYPQSARFTATAGQAVAVEVTVRFQAEDGQSYESTAQARVTLR